MGGHSSYELDRLIGEVVKITFKNGTVKMGRLENVKCGHTPYRLNTINSDYDIGFYKSQIKKVERVFDKYDSKRRQCYPKRNPISYVPDEEPDMYDIPESYITGHIPGDG